MSSGWISKIARARIYARDSYVCCYCGIQTQPYSKDMWKNNPLIVATLDHILSRHEIAKGCENDAEFSKAIKDASNLVCVCNGCNSSKKHTPLDIWCAIKGFDYNAIMAEIKRRIA